MREYVGSYPISSWDKALQPRLEGSCCGSCWGSCRTCGQKSSPHALFSLPGNHRVAGTSDNCLLMRGRFGEESECSVETWPRSFESFCWTIYMGLSKNMLPKNPIAFSSFKTIWVGGIPRFQTYHGKRACGSRRSRRSRCTIPDFEPDQRCKIWKGQVLECWPHLKLRFCAVPKDRNCSITKLQSPVVPKQLKYIYIYTKVEVQRKCPSICQVYQQDIPVAKQNLQRFPKKRRKKRHGCSPRFLTIASSLGTPQQVSIKAGLRVSMIQESCRSSKELPSRVESWQRL